MVLKKVDYERISWTLGRRGFLYRGNSQGAFEMRILKSLVEGNKPGYYGCEYTARRRPRKITFCHPCYLEPIRYLQDSVLRKGSDESGRTVPQPFAHFPSVMEINAEPYRDRVYSSTRGEGLIILNPINIDDIAILYGSHINHLLDRNPFHSDPDVTGRIKKFIETVDALEFSHDDVLSEYEGAPKQLLVELCLQAYGIRLTDFSEKEMNKIQEYIKILRAKLR